MPETTVVLDRDDMRRTLVRIAHEIIEKNPPDDERGESTDPSSAAGLAIVGIHRRGAILAQRLKGLIDEFTGTDTPLGSVDISFYRDDLRLRRDDATAGGQLAPVVLATQLEFPIDGRTIVIVDDVLYTGRTVRAAIEAIFDYGRPARVQLATLVDRGHRELPIRPDYVGKNLPTARDQRVNVHVVEMEGVDEVTIGPADSTNRSTA